MTEPRTYTLRVYEPYEQDKVLEFESVDSAILHSRKNRLFLDDCSLYETPEELNLYELMDPKTERWGGRARGV